jgi:hypothetical protein
MSNSNDRSRDELTIEELDAVNGGSKPKAIEIQDYGFGVSMPVTTG